MRKQDKKKKRGKDPDRCIKGVEAFSACMEMGRLGEAIGFVLTFLQGEGFHIKALTLTPLDLRVVFYRDQVEAKAKAEPYVFGCFPAKTALVDLASWYVSRGLHLWIESGYNKPLEAKQ